MKKKYVHIRQLIARGQAELSAFYAIVNMSMLLFLFLRDLFDLPKSWSVLCVVVIAVFAAVGMFLFGHLYDKHKMFEEEFLWMGDRNPYLKEILNNTKRSNKND